MDKCLISLTSITSQFRSFLHWTVFDLFFFYCVTVKTIYLLTSTAYPLTAMDTCNETIEIHVCKLTVGLEKLKIYKIMYVNVKSNWFMVNVGPSSYGCTSEDRKFLNAREASLVLSNLPCAHIT